MKRLICLAPIAIAACGQPEPIVITPPAELARCAGMPSAPVLPARDGTAETQLERDRLTLIYVLELRSAYGDCASRVAGLAAWIQEVGE